jgi:hypothetical protein
MREILKESSGNVLGFKAVGKIMPADYEELVPMVDVDPFFALEARFFHTDETNAAWEWLRE